MTKAELGTYRQELLALRHLLTGYVSGLAGEAFQKAGGQAGGNLSNTPLHPADLGTDHFEQEVTMSLLENDEQTLEEIAAALARIEAGAFGCCEECRKEIPPARLQALPYTRRCVECAREAEGRATEGQRVARV
jgi:DnaK suppressor protein